jgi:hypothetical protein
VGSFIVLTLLVLLGSSVADSSRRLRTAGAASAWPQGSVPTTDATARTNGGADATVEQEPDVASVRSIRRR